MIRYIFLLILILNYSYSQNINTDSLLLEVKKSINLNKLEIAEKQINLGLKTSPQYLDYYFFKAIIYKHHNKEELAIDSYEHIINNNINYLEAHIALINYLLSINNTAYAQKKVNLAKTIFDNQDIRNLQLEIYRRDRNVNKLINTLQSYIKKYPENLLYKTELYELKQKNHYHKFGIHYNNTIFNRKDQGPWHLTSFEYLRHKPKLSYACRLNYTDRRGFNDFSIHGYQIETDFYIVNNKKSYNYANISIGLNKPPFPNLKLGYSFYKNLNSKFEYEIGARYLNALETNFYSLVLGLTYYKNNYSFNIKNYNSLSNKNLYPSFLLTTNYNSNKKLIYNYSFIIGYGTNPDERYILGLVNNRQSLSSYRLGFGIKTKLNKNFFINLQTTVNNQEYIKDSYQLELNTNISIHYKLF